MPQYEYRCDHCDLTFEDLCSVRDRDVPQPCPECECDAHRVEISKTSFALKGSCWAADGYGSKR